MENNKSNVFISVRFEANNISESIKCIDYLTKRLYNNKM